MTYGNSDFTQLRINELTNIWNLVDRRIVYIQNVSYINVKLKFAFIQFHNFCVVRSTISLMLLFQKDHLNDLPSQSGTMFFGRASYQ